MGKYMYIVVGAYGILHTIYTYTPLLCRSVLCQIAASQGEQQQQQQLRYICIQENILQYTLIYYLKPAIAV